MDALNCEMCFYRGLSESLLEKHILNSHRHDPLFKIKCRKKNCGLTFRNYDTFKKHNYRTHNINLIEKPEEHQYFPINEFLVNTAPESLEYAVASASNCDDSYEESMKMKWQAAQFLINIRENGKTSQAVIIDIIKESILLHDTFSDNLLKEIRNQVDPETNLVNFDNIKQVIEEKSHNYSKGFSDLDTKYKLDKFLIKEFNMIQPIEFKIGTSVRWIKKNSRLDLIEEDNNAYIVPILDTLKNLLSNDEIRANVETPIQKDDDIYRTVLDAEAYKTNDFFQQTPGSLTILFYYDDLSVANPLGANSKKHNLSMFYWSLGNIDPRLRSNKNSIYLYAIVKTQSLKKHGLETFLEPLVKEINVLQTEGISIEIGDERKNFKGSILFIAGDNPASAFLGGFKKSVSAQSLCRTCMATKDNWKLNFNEKHFNLRNLETHQKHVDNVNKLNITKKQRNAYKLESGVNERSPLMDINNFDVTKCFPQDGMHVLLEGVCGIAVKALLRHYILEKKAFTIEELNDRILNYEFDYFSANKPATISQEHLNADNSLKQSASQMLGLVFTLPFLISPFLENEEEKEHMFCHTILVQILNTCFAYEISEENVCLLERMIEVFVLRFNRLYPSLIVPKFHFLIHIPMYIRLFGPARQQWCFRFEAAHSFFKFLMPVVRSFKNSPLTLSYRFQSRLCSQLATYPGKESTKFLYQGDEISEGQTVILQNLPNAHLFLSYVDQIDYLHPLKIMRSPKIQSYGATYTPGSIFLFDCSDESFPIFAKIKDIYVIKKKIVFLYNLLETSEYDQILNAYYVASSKNNHEDVILLQDLIFPHSIPTFLNKNQTAVCLLFHERSEFFG